MHTRTHTRAYTHTVKSREECNKAFYCRAIRNLTCCCLHNGWGTAGTTTFLWPMHHLLPLCPWAKHLTPPHNCSASKGAALLLTLCLSTCVLSNQWIIKLYSIPCILWVLEKLLKQLWLTLTYLLYIVALLPTVEWFQYIVWAIFSTMIPIRDSNILLKKVPQKKDQQIPLWNYTPETFV